MKKCCVYVVLLLFPILVLGQVNQMEKQTNEGGFRTDSVNSLIPMEKQSLLRDVDVIVNSRISYSSKFLDGKQTIANFNADQLRFEIKGKIHEKIYFRFRNRYTSEPIPGNLDNVSRSVDLAFVKIDIAPRTNVSFGKLVADWGGYEFDYNPIDILNYNDIVGNADSFLVGAGITHTLKDDRNSFTFQALNSRTKTFQELYGEAAPPNIESTSYPLAFVGNWRGKFFGGKFETTYSYSFFNEAKHAQMNAVALGNKLKTKKFILYYDFQYSNEGLDRKGLVSGVIREQYKFAAQNALYIDNWLRAEYMVAPKVNVLLTLMSSNHYWKNNPDHDAPSMLTTSYGIIPTIQYLPFKDTNIKFYLGYVGRKYDYTDYAENSFGAKDYTTGLVSFGFIAPLLLL
ncbi:porin [Flavobacterium hercynium]|uniref:Porin n=1 Tax=Flavobacterium hercynium TaxID=387094 RepID=A0A226H4W7_9FLAO|nr:porin [Flavobacterium hercynium]OXA88691.1 hypothetical protein B0A66_14895 [Flavobacterium hercynium]SMP34427.1 Phosphate-selective porin O and P [Flavobacterium hercynium]